VEGVLEHRPDALDDVSERHRPQASRERRTDPFKVSAGEPRHEARFGECVYDGLADRIIVGPGSRRELARIAEQLLGCEKPVAQVPNRQAVAMNTWNAADLKIVSLVDILS